MLRVVLEENTHRISNHRGKLAAIVQYVYSLAASRLQPFLRGALARRRLPDVHWEVLSDVSAPRSTAAVIQYRVDRARKIDNGVKMFGSTGDNVMIWARLFRSLGATSTCQTSRGEAHCMQGGVQPRQSRSRVFATKGAPHRCTRKYLNRQIEGKL